MNQHTIWLLEADMHFAVGPSISQVTAEGLFPSLVAVPVWFLAAL